MPENNCVEIYFDLLELRTRREVGRHYLAKRTKYEASSWLHCTNSGAKNNLIGEMPILSTA